jgi:hydroxymethylpyrimidine pyrophosphatase-like HAD family hydrolase
MCQAVVIEPLTAPGRQSELALELPEFRLIRATSPLDHVSTWFEVFPEGVGKSSAAAWVRDRMGGVVGSCVAVGNDYNDVDLLDCFPARGRAVCRRWRRSPCRCF